MNSPGALKCPSSFQLSLRQITMIFCLLDVDHNRLSAFRGELDQTFHSILPVALALVLLAHVTELSLGGLQQ